MANINQMGNPPQISACQMSQVLRRLPNHSFPAGDTHNSTPSSMSVAIRDQQAPIWAWHDAMVHCGNICSTCRTAFGGDWFRSFDLGPPSEIRLRSKCLFCQKITRLIQQFVQYFQDERVHCEHFQVGEVLVTQSGIHLGRLVLRAEEHCRQRENLHSGLNYEKLRQWISECVTAHNHPLRDCFTRYQIPIDITLVDVVNSCLVKASTRERYLALSYVWGNTSSFVTVISNRIELEQTGSLLQHADRIGSLICNAIELVHNLGERYLWVDSLCIEQDNSSQKQAQINSMDIIYSQALITIVAISSESASSNLPGIVTDLQPTPIAPGLILDTMAPVFGAILTSSVYETRAWTLQERVLSQRCLFMSKHGVIFNCPWEWRDRNGNFKLLEELNTVPFLHHPSKELPDLSWTTHFRAYADLVKQYKTRHLSHATDSLNAFYGILHLFQAALGGEMISGLPEAYLDIALLWVPNGPISRNKNFPSWSWAGWTGPCCYIGPPYLEGWVQLIDSEVEEFEWAPVGRRQTAKRKLYSTVRRFSANESQIPQPIEEPRLIDVLYFRTAAITARYFPLGDVVCYETVDHDTRPRVVTRKIDCEELREGLCANLDGKNPPYKSIVDTQGRQCGVVLNSDFSLDVYMSGWEQRPLEYIILSKVQCPGMASLSHPDVHSLCWYYVLLIEWHSEYAERLALCAISCRAWMLANPKMKNIALK